METGPTDPDGLEVVDRFDGGAGWIAHPGETMERASHAVESEGELWIVDPVDADGVDDLLAGFAEPAGVVVLLDRHTRDAAAVATRHGVPVYVPEWMSGVADGIDAPTRRFGEGLAGFEAGRLVDNALWQEATLFDGETLLVPEALGTAAYFLAPGESLGVHPMLRPLPPKGLREYDPDRLLVGHGEGLADSEPGDVGRTIRRAIEDSRSRAPSLYLKTVRSALGFR